jgi:transposase InsO family protein
MQFAIVPGSPTRERGRIARNVSRTRSAWHGKRRPTRAILHHSDPASQRSCITAILHHSDRGVQYACADYRGLLARHGLQLSMSRRGNCYDNAVTESMFGTLKTKLVHHESYATREAARQSLFEYIEVFYNRQRRHSALGYRSPAEHEKQLLDGAQAYRRSEADAALEKESAHECRDRARPGKDLAGHQPRTPNPTSKSCK